jgi:hypothetical protein
MLVDRSRFSSHGDKLNRQIQEVERLVTRRKQRIALTSNRQKIQFSKTKNSAATEAPNNGQRRLARMKLPARRGGRERNLVCVHTVESSRAFQSISIRHSPIYRKRRNSLKINARRISTRGQNCIPTITSENRNAEACAGETACPPWRAQKEQSSYCHQRITFGTGYSQRASYKQGRKQMRTLLVIVMLAVSASYAQAQDPGQMAAQQAAQQATQQANQDAQQAMQMSQQAALTAAQQAQMAQAAAATPPCCAIAKPKFSVKAGSYASPVTVKLTDKTRGAIIYYTTDGWTPTAASNRYLGPITISSTTTLQAIAVGPYYAYSGRSFVVSAQYNINSPAATLPAPANPPAAAEAATEVSPDGKVTLAQGTPVPLIFGADVNSKTASVGDLIPLALSDDLKVGNVVVARKGSAAAALVIQVDKTGAGGAPGDITFQVNSLTVNGSVIQLSGFATKEGEAKPPNAAFLIPVVGPLTVLKHGADAEIKKGTPFTAFVNADTALSPAK